MLKTNLSIMLAFRIAALAALLGSLVTSPAHAQMPTSLVAEGEARASSQGRRAVYRIHVGAGAEGASFGFEYQLPHWPNPGVTLGSPISITSVELKGPGTLAPGPTRAYSATPRRSHGPTCMRQRQTFIRSSYAVEMPAFSNAVIELRASGSYPIWPMTDYEVSFSTFKTDRRTAPRELFGSVSTPPLGRKGTQIEMWSVGKGGAGDGSRITPELAGRTSPALKHEWISVRAVLTTSGGVRLAQWGNPRPYAIRMGRVRTDSHGRFRLSPRRFPYSGQYAIIARSKAKGKAVSDWNCGPFFNGIEES